MRVFLGIDLRDTLGAAAEAWGAAVAAAMGPAAAGALAWVPAPRVHVTVHFFGALDAAAVDAVRRALGGAVPEAPFDLTLGGGGTFPPGGRPRVLWLACDRGREALERLHAWVEPRVAGIGQPDRHGAFAPHLTIARARRDGPPGFGRLLRDAVARVPAPAGRARVEALTLFESVPAAKGPAYVPIGRVPLAG
jgi:2'-5' RNA ligase